MLSLPLLKLTSFQRRKSIFYSIFAALSLVVIDLAANGHVTWFSLAGILPAVIAVTFFPERLVPFWGTLGTALAVFYWTVAAQHLILSLLLASIATVFLTPVVLGLLRAADASTSKEKLQ